MELKDATALLALLIGAAGLSLSVFNFFVARRKDRRSLTVRLSAGMAFDIDPAIDEQWLLTASVGNTGFRPVSVNSIQFQGRDSHRFIILQSIAMPPLPRVVPEGEAVQVYTIAAQVVEGLRRAGHHGATQVRAIVKDALGDDFTSDWLDIDTTQED